MEEEDPGRDWGNVHKAWKKVASRHQLAMRGPSSLREFGCQMLLGEGELRRALWVPRTESEEICSRPEGTLQHVEEKTRKGSGCQSHYFFKGLVRER